MRIVHWLMQLCREMIVAVHNKTNQYVKTVIKYVCLVLVIFIIQAVMFEGIMLLDVTDEIVQNLKLAVGAVGFTISIFFLIRLRNALIDLNKGTS